MVVRLVAGGPAERGGDVLEGDVLEAVEGVRPPAGACPGRDCSRLLSENKNKKTHWSVKVWLPVDEIPSEDATRNRWLGDGRGACAHHRAAGVGG